VSLVDGLEFLRRMRRQLNRQRVIDALVSYVAPPSIPPPVWRHMLRTIALEYDRAPVYVRNGVAEAMTEMVTGRSLEERAYVEGLVDQLTRPEPREPIWRPQPRAWGPSPPSRTVH